MNTNFTDIINAMTDGTKDFSINALTCGGTATLNGNVILGNSSADDLTVTASLASTLPIKTTGTYGIGSSTKGLSTVYFGNGSNSNTVGLLSGVTTSSYTVTLPTAAPTASGQVLAATTAGVASWAYNGLIATTVYTTSGSPHTWTKATNNARYIRVIVQAGGGGGGGTSTTAYRMGNGGGGGACGVKIIAAASLGTTETITVGAGGTAGSNTTAGGTGGTSSFGSHVSATGGNGGTSDVRNATGGGATAGQATASGADYVYAGGPSVMVNSDASAYAISGQGGNSLFGSGGRAREGTGTGVSPLGYGAGGGGAANTGSTQGTGAVGGAGLVIVEEYA